MVVHAPDPCLDFVHENFGRLEPPKLGEAIRQLLLGESSILSNLLDPLAHWGNGHFICAVSHTPIMPKMEGLRQWGSMKMKRRLKPSNFRGF